MPFNGNGRNIKFHDKGRYQGPYCISYARRPYPRAAIGSLITLQGRYNMKDNENYFAFSHMARKEANKGLQGLALFDAVFAAACLWLFDNEINTGKAREATNNWIKDNT